MRMTIDKWLKNAVRRFKKHDIPTARLDALVLLEDTLNTDRAQLLAHPETTLTNEQQKHLATLISRRSTHEPLAYIRGKTEFYGRDFILTPAVLEPRPESETMIDLLKKLPPEARKAVIDVGTGSGALAITAALELGTVQIIATDIDTACLVVARQNCQKHKVTIDLKQADLIEDITLPIGTTILANLPYVPDSYHINEAAAMEPRLAIFGGEDGLDLYHRLFNQLASQTNKPAYVLTESLPFQHQALAKIAKQHGYTILQAQDFIQIFCLDNKFS